jgi:exodeoxyribonuclease VIII
VLRFKEYVELEGENWSTLKEMGRSPLHYKYRKDHPREDSVTLAKGRGIHTAVLEPEKFDSEYVIFPGKTRKGKEWDAFKEEHAHQTILKADERDKVWGAAEAVRRHPEVKALMRSGVSEQSYKWIDVESQLQCKCRVDWIGSALFDLKSTGDVDDRKFGNIAARLMYYGQLAMYRDGAGHRSKVFIVAVEGEPPHDVSVFSVPEDALFAGQELYKGFLKRVVECRASGVWPGRYPEVTELSLPRYVYEDDELEDGESVIVEDDET